MRLQLVCLLLVLLSVSAVNYVSFEEKHITRVRRDGTCRQRMRPINNVHGDCRKKNTFIVDPNDSVSKLCNQGDGVLTSSSSYDLINCLGTGSFPNCKYTESRLNAYIKIQCNSGKPQHYIGTSWTPGL
ncbi:hypothetical protein Q5P01_005680 [Channa striata]|uniref:Ribonuclease A-domain domain-containing protein n=1 Tax=Channa striata TaxID=64152 RepID=A0AA88T1H7_CHASR|nr:hypothetical protein Q5P01_005680 [Channa striata]